MLGKGKNCMGVTQLIENKMYIFEKVILCAFGFDHFLLDFAFVMTNGSLDKL